MDGHRSALLLVLLAMAAGVAGCDSGEGVAEPEVEPALGAYQDVIVPGELYVVYSALDSLGGPAVEVNTSNIYVLRGSPTATDREVWLFGAGYGDPDGDIPAYRGRIDALRGAAADAADVDHLVREAFGLDRASVALRFVVPHFHLDHVNQELFDALFALGYAEERTRVYVHVLDRIPFETCTTACCGAEPCDEQSPLFGAPFAPPLTDALLGRFEVLGRPDDPCNAELLTFEAPTGPWVVRKEAGRAGGGHTDGNVNLDGEALGYRFYGGTSRVCTAPEGFIRVPIHGRLP